METSCMHQPRGPLFHCGPTDLYSEQEKERSWLDIHLYSCLFPCLGLIHISKVCLQATVVETAYIQALGLNSDFKNITVSQGGQIYET